MSNYLTKEAIADIFKKHAGSETNSGSTEGQIALFTYRINNLTEHLKINKKDHATRRSLLKMVGKRKALLGYLAKKDLNKYRALIAELGIRDSRNK